MNVVHAHPPNIDQIDVVFHVKQRHGIYYTYGDTIYNPSGVEISPALKAHEGVHYDRQTNDPAKIDAWWDKYLVDPEFRLAEELAAHQVEYKVYCGYVKDRNRQHRMLIGIAQRLAGPLYGNLLSATKARKLIAA